MHCARVQQRGEGRERAVWRISGASVGRNPAQSSGVGVQGTGYIPYTTLPRFQEVAGVGEPSQGHHEVLTGECGPGTQVRRAAQDAGTAERAESSNHVFVISLVDSIRYGAIPATPVHCFESPVLLLRVRTIEKAGPSRPRLTLQIFLSGSGGEYLYTT